MTSKRHVVLASAAPRTTCGEETVHDGDTRKRPKFATTTARIVPLEFSAPEEIWHHLTRPRHLPRIPGIPRLPVRKIAATAVALIPKRSRHRAQFNLPGTTLGFAGWVLIFAGAAASIAGLQFVEPHYRSEPERYQRWLARRGTRAVDATLAEIGPSINIPSVRAEPFDELYAACYTYSDSAVTFNSEHEFLEFDLMDSSGSRERARNHPPEWAASTFDHARRFLRYG